MSLGTHMEIHHILIDIQQALKTMQENPEKGNITDFKKQKQEGARLMLKGAIQRLLEETKNIPEVHSIAQKLSTARLEEIPRHLEKLAGMAAEEPEQRTYKIPRLPSEIRDDVFADLNEIQRCMNAGCHRSAVVLCGRVMETALHRKYFEATGNDLLEKAPGTGLGTLIAKLSEHGVKLDPGLPNQIHLINQVRVFSVHTKKESFSPSKTQAEAIVLYTLDILDKLFR
jgi:hypothetical protein